MSPIIAKLITAYFMTGKGKPDKVLNKLGEDVLGSVLGSTLDKDGNITQGTLDMIQNLKGGKKPRMSKERKEALKRLSTPGAYDKKMSKAILQDLIGPALPGIITTAGNVLNAQLQIAPAVSQNVAENVANNIPDAYLKGTSLGSLPGMIKGAAAAHTLRNVAKGMGLQGIANAAATGVNTFVNQSRRDDALDRMNRRAMDQQIATGQNNNSAYYNLQNQQLKQAANQVAGGEF